VQFRVSDGAHRAYHALLEELREGDVAGYRRFLRMDPASFDLLLHKVAPLITKENTRLRLSIPAEEPNSRANTSVAFFLVFRSWYSLHFMSYKQGLASYSLINAKIFSSVHSIAIRSYGKKIYRKLATSTNLHV
jgi:hypothetical protein